MFINSKTSKFYFDIIKIIDIYNKNYFHLHKYDAHIYFLFDLETNQKNKRLRVLGQKSHRFLSST